MPSLGMISLEEEEMRRVIQEAKELRVSSLQKDTSRSGGRQKKSSRWRPPQVTPTCLQLATLASLILRCESSEQCKGPESTGEDESHLKDVATFILIALGVVKLLEIAWNCLKKGWRRLTAARVEPEAEPAIADVQEPAPARVVAPLAAEAPAAAPPGQVEQEIPEPIVGARNEVAAARGLARRAGRDATVHTHDCGVRTRMGTEPLAIRACDFCVRLQERENAGLQIPRTVVRQVRMSRTSFGNFTREVANG